MTDSPSGSRLREELLQLFGNMESVRSELATIRHPEAEEDRLKTLSEHLDAIVEATEQATETILGANEKIEGLLDQISQKADNPEVGELVDQIALQVAETYQACSFQDITGQWVGKAATSLKVIDQSVGRIVDLWGPDGLSSVPVEGDTREGDEALLNGPQLGGVATSQDDIDKLFD